MKVERSMPVSLICSRNLRKWTEAPATVFILPCILRVRSCGSTVPHSSAAENSVFVSKLPKGSAAPPVNNNLPAVRVGWAAPWCVKCRSTCASPYPSVLTEAVVGSSSPWIYIMWRQCCFSSSKLMAGKAKDLPVDCTLPFLLEIIILAPESVPCSFQGIRQPFSVSML